MNRRFSHVGLALACMAWLTACVEPPSWFPFEARRTPRVFAYHLPLVPEPGGVVNVLSRVDGLAPEDIDEARVRLELPDGDSDTQTCSAIGSIATYNCQFDLDGIPDDTQLVFRATAKLKSHVPGPSLLRADVFRTTVANLRDDGEPRVVTVREPLAPRAALEGKPYAVKTMLVRDAAEGFTTHSFVAAANALIHEAILEDPVYRWRANQFAFYLYTEPAATSDYYSGKNTRCGQNPWPDQPELPAAVASMDAIGVLHRRTGPGGNFGGESVGGFRDCASRVLAAFETNGDPPPIGTFSMKHGNLSSKRLGAHEFGHAVFGLSDEYNETTTQRTSPAGNALGGADTECCCFESDDDGSTTSGETMGPGNLPETVAGPQANAQLYCMNAQGDLMISGLVGGPIPNGTEPCSDDFVASAPLDCRASDAPQSCPSLRGECVREVMWLGATDVPSDASSYNNIFDGEAQCNAARSALLEHPGIEDAAAGMLFACSEQCGPESGSGPCACEEAAEYWRLDRDPVIDGDVDVGDLMRRLDATVHHGAACNHCIETSLCVRWERARGRSTQQTWDYCRAPPPDIIEQQEATRGIVASIVDFFRELFGGART